MANKITNRFGELLGWNNVTFRFLGRNLVGITELEYNDSESIENGYGSGKMPIGFKRGNYEASAKVVLLKEEVIAIEEALPEGMRIQDIVFPIIVKYEYNNEFSLKTIFQTFQN